ncbi:MAG: DUF11 domain-containing protein [Anaerolineae bacterium]|nr:DUF11 domain-containing protein [Anaerolineae bacterium]
MKSRFLIRLLCAFVWLGVVGVGPFAGVHTPVLARDETGEVSEIGNLISSGEFIEIVSYDSWGIEIELRSPDLAVAVLQTESGTCDLLTMEGYAETGTPGAPALPALNATLGIPEGVEVAVEILERDTERIFGTQALCPAPEIIVEQSIGEPPQYLGEKRIFDPSEYSVDALTPSVPVEIASTGFIRSQRVAQLLFRPLQYNPVSGALLQTRWARVRVSFSEPVFTRTGDPGVDEGFFEELLGNTLVNYDLSRAWRVASAPGVSEVRSQSVPNPMYRILVETAGLYQITYETLQAVDPTVDLSVVDPRTFHLTNQGVEVAIFITGDDPESFEPGDAILFYGEAIDAKYTDTNVYWLTWNAFFGARMPEINGTPGSGVTPTSFRTTMRLEEDLLYQSNSPDRDNDHWYWDYVYVTGGVSVRNPLSFTLDLPQVAVGMPDATLRGMLMSFSAIPNHSTQVRINGAPVYTATWDAGDYHAFSVDFSHALLAKGVNTITVEGGLGVTTDVALINWFEVDYYAAYETGADQLFFDGDQSGTWKYEVAGFDSLALDVLDITNPKVPARILNGAVQLAGPYTLAFQHTITGEHHYLALGEGQRLIPAKIERDTISDLRNPENAADLIIISYADFYAAVAPLAQYRESQGYRVMLTDVQDVFDEFGFGLYDPEAIRDFLAYAYDTWVAPAPAYVLLVGDGNHDPKDNQGYGEISYIPPYLADVDPWISEAPADNRYVSISGADVLPDMHLGRLPVHSAAEATALVDKILAYEQSPPAGTWNEQAIFVADNADAGGNFAGFSNTIADNYVPSPYTTEKIYLGVTHDTSGARTALMNALNAGRLLVNYIGHSSTQFWASEKLLQLSNLPGISNAGRLPFVVPMTCLEGSFSYPSPPGVDYSSLGESIVRLAQHGAIASWSPTGMGVASGHDVMNRYLYQAIFFDDVIDLGAAATIGKVALGGLGHDELIETYILFGDPLTHLNVLGADVGIEKMGSPAGPIWPGDWLTYTLTYSNTGPATAHHVVISDTLPAGLISPTVQSSEAMLTLRPGTMFVWDVADLEAGEGGVITVTAQVNPRFAGLLTNVATIETSAQDDDLGNNTSEPVVIEVIAPDLVIDKTAPHSALPGEVITYTLTFANVGTALATGSVITDLIPAAVLTPTVISATENVIPRPGTTFVWDVADLDVDEGGAIVLQGTVDPNFSGTLINEATLSTDTLEAFIDNNHAETHTGVLVSDLWIEKTGPVEALPGQTLTYVLTYGNLGNGVAEGVVITDSLPLGLTSPVVTSTGSLTPRPGTSFVWDIATLAPGDSEVITVTATVEPAFRGTLSNSAMITTTASFDSDATNNATSPVETVVAVADLALTKSAPTQVVAGEQLVYTLAFTNVDVLPAASVVLTDTLPAQLTGVSVTSSGVLATARPGTAYVWDIEDLDPGVGGVITITGTVDAAFTGVLQNAASITTATPEASTSNNVDQVSTQVDAPTYADLVLTKSAPTQVVAGEQLVYTLVFMNVDVLPAASVVLTDTLPAQLTGVSVTSSGVLATARPGTAYVWDIEDLDPGVGGVITITGTVDVAFTGVLQNAAAISTATQEANTVNNVDQVSTQVDPPGRVVFLPLLMR